MLTTIFGRILTANLSCWTLKKVKIEWSKKNLCFYLFFSLKAKLQELKFEFDQNKMGIEPRINLQLTGKISLKLDSNSSLLLEYGHKCRIQLVHVLYPLMCSVFRSLSISFEFKAVL